MFTNKWTFSLASLILIIAFGLILGTPSVVAHGPDNTIPDHEHPLKMTIPADSNAGTVEVTPHGFHPMATLAAMGLAGSKVSGTQIMVAADPANTFTLIVTFDEPVVKSKSVEKVDLTTSPLGLNDFTIVVRDALGDVVNSAVGIGDPMRQTGDKEGKILETVITVKTAAIPNGTKGDALEYLSLHAKVNADVVYGRQLEDEDDPTVSIPGAGNLQSPTVSFTLVKELTPIPDTTPPVVSITAPEPAAPTSTGELVFDIMVDEMLGSGANSLGLHDFMIKGAASSVLEPTADNNFTLTIMPKMGMSVMVTLDSAMGSVIGDVAGNVWMGKESATYYAPLQLVNYSFAVSATDPDQLNVTLVFNRNVTLDSIDIDEHGGHKTKKAADAVKVAGMDYTYSVLVDAPGHATRAETYMSLEAGVTAMDPAGSMTSADQVLTYMPPTVEGPKITAMPDPINCDTGSVITFTGSVSSLAMSDITISAGWKVGMEDNNPTDGTIRIVPDGNNAIGVTTVTVTLAANAVGNHGAITTTFTVGPVLTIPANSYILVIHPAHADTTHLNDPYVLGSFPIRAPEVAIQHWECMPDLTVFFNRDVPGIGGGAIVIKQADGPKGHTGGAIAKGSVGLSEIMWATDQGIQYGGAADPNTGRLSRTNYDHTREQWIELHNRNNTEVKVTLFSRPTNEALTTEPDEIDRVSNYNTNNWWDLPGHNGNSEFGVDFVSMRRGKHDSAGKTPDQAAGYAHGDWNGIYPNRWTASDFSYLTARAGLWQTLDPGNQNYDFFGTPGRSNQLGRSHPILRTDVKMDTIVFNEVANRRDQTLEWIELKNVSGGEVNLKKYQISLATKTGTDVAFYTFPDNDNIKLAAGEVLLLLDTDPRDNDNHPIAVGFNRDDGNDQALGIGDDATKYKIANFPEGGLPDHGNFVLYLRNRNDRLKSHEGVIDVIGWSDQLADASIHTQIWPMKVFGTPDKRNSMAVETVHYRQHLKKDPDEYTHGDKKDEHVPLRDAGYTGIGYKRHALRTAAHAGTPGYEEIRKNLVPDITATGSLTISEIMYDQGDGEYPQWIEIYNSSETQAINLHSEAGWRLIIENFDDDEIPIARLSGTLNFKNSEVQTILPQQTVLIASTRARNSGSAFFDTRVVFPETRVFSVWSDQRDELGMKRSTDPILSDRGFYIELIDGKDNFSDGVGNLIKSPNRRVAATIEWELSDINGDMMEDDGRSSILRRYREFKDGEPVGRYTAAEIEDMGVEAGGWISAYKTDFRDVRQTWYGHPDDYGSPGITGGRVLPVTLSKFRPERLDDGSIVVRWITQSELNNAGFNILRSDTRSGEYKQINTKMIAGQGTTSEKTTYEWKDTTAKPNVVYYYQIQDVSLDGQVATLAQTRLKGHVSPAGKVTTTWGELKALQ